MKSVAEPSLHSLTPLEDVSGRAAEQLLDAACVVLLSRIEQRNAADAERKEKQQKM